jgi:DNA-binding MarR family transcriptional regulator
MFDDPRWSDDPRDRRDDDWRDRDNDDTLTLARGPRDREDGLDPRTVFMRNLNLPRGRDREIVHDIRDRQCTLRGSETRTLSTIGAFRIVSARDLRDHNDRPADPRSGDLRHLREEGLIRTERLDGHREHVVVLTDRGRDVLNAHRDERHKDHRQEFYAGLVKPREVEHDSQIYHAYLQEAERIAERDARIERVVLDYELNGEYQRWLHGRDGDCEECCGRPDRETHEIEEWARDHDLPYFDDQVHFPDLRIEYEELDGRRDHEDVEVVTIHYRGAHGAAAARSGFSCYRGSSARISGGGGGRGGRGSAHPSPAEEFLG